MKPITSMSTGAKILNDSIQCLLIVSLLGISLFGTAGKLSWYRAWIFLGVYGICYWSSTILLFLKTPELMDERRKKHPGIKPWDKVLVLSYQLLYFPVFIIVGLSERFHWYRVSLWAICFGYILIFLAFLLMTWAPLVNKNLETYIRIQKERDHQVCTSGPYNYIRHPANLGLILLFLGIPVSLGSLWALIPSLFAAFLIIVRTQLEDNFLFKELNGYAKYKENTRYRLLPGIW